MSCKTVEHTSWNSTWCLPFPVSRPELAILPRSLHLATFHDHEAQKPTKAFSFVKVGGELAGIG